MRGMNRTPIAAGQQVRHLATGRRMLVMELAGDRVRCVWFNGRYCVHALVRREELFPCDEAD